MLVLCGVELSNVCRIQCHQLFHRLLKLGALLGPDLLHLAQALIGCKVLLGLFVLGDQFGDLLDQVDLYLARRVLNHNGSTSMIAYIDDSSVHIVTTFFIAFLAFFFS